MISALLMIMLYMAYRHVKSPSFMFYRAWRTKRGIPVMASVEYLLLHPRSPGDPYQPTVHSVMPIAYPRGLGKITMEIAYSYTVSERLYIGRWWKGSPDRKNAIRVYETLKREGLRVRFCSDQPDLSAPDQQEFAELDRMGVDYPSIRNGDESPDSQGH